MAGNLPPGTTPGDIDDAFGEPRDPPPEPEPDRPECTKCSAPLPWSKGTDDPPLCDDCSIDEDESDEERSDMLVDDE